MNEEILEQIRIITTIAGIGLYIISITNLWLRFPHAYYSIKPISGITMIGDNFSYDINYT